MHVYDRLVSSLAKQSICCFVKLVITVINICLKLILYRNPGFDSYTGKSGVNILPKEQIFSPMLPSCDHKVSPFLPHFCDYMRGSVATKPLTAWGPGARLRAPGGVQGQSPWWGSRGQCPRKLQGFSQFNILRNSLQRALS